MSNEQRPKTNVAEWARQIGWCGYYLAPPATAHRRRRGPRIITGPYGAARWPLCNPTLPDTSPMKIQDKQLWYGYLEAGKKSTAVLLDRSHNTGNSDTLYLYNLTRGEILENSRKIVEPTLRELKGKETALTDTLQTAYETARCFFSSRVFVFLALPEK